MWLFKCRSCGYLIAPGEDCGPLGYGAYHLGCEPGEESQAAEDFWTDQAIDQRQEESVV